MSYCKYSFSCQWYSKKDCFNEEYKVKCDIRYEKQLEDISEESLKLEKESSKLVELAERMLEKN